MPERSTYINAQYILSPMGEGAGNNWEAVLAGRSAVSLHRRQEFGDHPVCASLFSAGQWQEILADSPAGTTPFEALVLRALHKTTALAGIDLADRKTLLILASTKGNIGRLQAGMKDPHHQTGLLPSAHKIANLAGYHSLPVLVSNACISGMTAILSAGRLIQSGAYSRAVVVGADCISPFIVAGFRSFQALSEETCKPFDADRKGINLGEAVAAMVLSTKPSPLFLSGGSTSSDANHISGPSRTGEEMAEAIRRSLHSAQLTPAELGAISAHGTATPFNDEMESRAFMLCGLDKTPAFSLKACFGHTLGAAGLLESVIALHALSAGTVPASKGYQHHGVSQPVTIAASNLPAPDIKHILKTGSGFGGCNAALLFSKKN